MSASAAAATAVKFTSAFRIAGLNYLDALTVQTTALRKVLKEPLRTEALGRASFKYRDFTYTDGKENAGGEPRGFRPGRRPQR
jgi:chromosome segregation ATPase